MTTLYDLLNKNERFLVSTRTAIDMHVEVKELTIKQLNKLALLPLDVKPNFGGLPLSAFAVIQLTIRAARKNKPIF